jgi:hypothetical protein
MGRAWPPNLTRGNLLLAGLKFLFDALASLRRQPLRRLQALVLVASVSSGVQEFQLAAISAAPFAQEQMQLKPNPFEE